MTEILLIEDSLASRTMISDLLENHGLVVKIASDGIQALELLKKYQPDLIVLDIVMPNMNGYEVCRQIKSNPQTQEIPVVICSIKGENFDRYWGLKQGADAYIAKPFQPTELMDKIEQLLRT
jgi:twitching motility two-component system response regulator PilH